MRSSILLQYSCLLSTVALAAPRSDQKVIGDHTLINPGTIVSRLRESFIIPDILPEDFEPKLPIALTYPQAHEEVFYGNIIKPENTTSRPILQLGALFPTATTTSSANKTYTLVLSDPDATSHAKPVKGQMCHWIATGIKPHDSYSTDGMHDIELHRLVLSEDDDDAWDVKDLVEYLPPSPPPKTGFHRYVFVLLEPESEKHAGRKLKKPKDRPRWGYKKQGRGVMKWAKKNHLVPVGANYFLAQNAKQ